MPNYIPVTKERHATKRWRRYRSYAFAAQQTGVPLVGAELGQAAHTFPVAFIKQGETFVLVAVLGLVQGRNLFVTPDGRWFGPYVPAALRGYPFAFARTEQGKQVFCVDEASGLVIDGPDGEPFLDETGNGPSKQVKQLLDFLLKVEQNRVGTATATATLQSVGLVEPWPIVLKTENGDQRVEGLFRVNEPALNALDDAAFLELRRKGAIAVAYAQLISMSNLGVLSRLSAVQAPAQPQAAPQMQLGQDLDLSFLESGGTLKLG
jgi:hypothetical protein